MINFTKVTLTLVPKLDLDMVKMYHHTKNEVSMSRHSKVIAQMDIQTHTQRQTAWKHYFAVYAGGNKIFIVTFISWSSALVSTVQSRGGSRIWSGGAQIVTCLKLPFWGLSFVEFWCWGLIFGGQGAPLGPPLQSKKDTKWHLWSAGNFNLVGFPNTCVIWLLAIGNELVLKIFQVQEGFCYLPVTNFWFDWLSGFYFLKA